MHKAAPDRMRTEADDMQRGLNTPPLWHGVQPRCATSHTAATPERARGAHVVRRV